jgi:hypothetical protein
MDRDYLLVLKVDVLQRAMKQTFLRIVKAVIDKQMTQAKAIVVLHKGHVSNTGCKKDCLTVLVYFQHLLPSIGSSYTKTITMYAIGKQISRML